MSSVLLPITASHVAGSVTARSTIHAVAISEPLQRALSGAEAQCRRYTAVCGVSGLVLAGRLVRDSDGADHGLVLRWPPPIVDRCPDCALALGTRGRRRGDIDWHETPEASGS